MPPRQRLKADESQRESVQEPENRSNGNSSSSTKASRSPKSPTAKASLASRSSSPSSSSSSSRLGNAARYAALFVLVAGVVFYESQRLLPSPAQLPVPAVLQDPLVSTSPKVRDLTRGDIFSDDFRAPISEAEVKERREAVRQAFKVNPGRRFFHF